MKYLILLLLLTSCTAEYHFGKFIKKGGKVDTKIELVEYTDTIKVNGKDSIVVVRVPVTCPDVKVPEPRWRTKLEYRYKYKIHRDTVRLNRDVVKYQYKTVKVQEKSKKRRFAWLWWFVTGAVSYAVVRFIFKYFV